jgi:hypothetical protein
MTEQTHNQAHVVIEYFGESNNMCVIGVFSTAERAQEVMDATPDRLMTLRTVVVDKAYLGTTEEDAPVCDY